MADYISREELEKAVSKPSMFDINKDDVLALIAEIPAADVVPKSEVVRLQSQVNRLKKYDEERDIALHARLIANTRSQVAREIFEQIDSFIHRYCNETHYVIGDFSWDITELKKKYMEEKP